MRYEVVAVRADLTRLARQVKGSGPNMVLFHGGMGSHSHWDRNVAALAEHFKVHAFDLPGFGDSPDAPCSLDPETYLDWIASQAAEIPGGLHLAGFSFGGAVAAATARRLGTRIERLSLLGPGGFGNPAGRSIPLRAMPRGDATESEKRSVIAHNLGQWMLAQTPEPGDRVVDIQKSNIERARYDSRSVSLRDMLVPDLSEISCPVQIIWGGSDPLAYPSIADRMQRCLAARDDIAFHIIPGAGHWVQFEAAAAVNSLLISFHRQETSA